MDIIQWPVKRQGILCIEQTSAQLARHMKHPGQANGAERFQPIGILNVDGYYDALLIFVNHMVAQGLLKYTHASLLMVESDAGALLERFASFEAQPHDKLLNRGRAQG